MATGAVPLHRLTGSSPRRLPPPVAGSGAFGAAAQLAAKATKAKGTVRQRACHLCGKRGRQALVQKSCACRDDAGFVHVGCLLEHVQADGDVKLWRECGLCERAYQGTVRLELARAVREQIDSVPICA